MKKLLLPLFAVATLYSCSNTDDDTVTVDPNAKYLNGYFITNEGNFGSGNASISHLSADFNTVTNNIFKTANNKDLGDVAQSIVVNGDYAFVIVNNSNTIEVVNKKTFQSVYTITENVVSPRYAVIQNNKLYVTSLSKATVTIYDAKTYAFIKTVELNNTAENIVATTNYIYAANNAYSGKLIEIIDTKTDTNTVDISFDHPINGLATNGQFVYALETGNSESKIWKLEATTKSTSTAIAQGNARYLVAEGTNLYYTLGRGVYKTSDALTTAGTKLFDVAEGVDSYSHLYGFNVLNGTIFTSDSKGFKDNGVVTLYKEDGTVIKELKTGMGPNGIFKF
ncbi:MAG TPA: DUF5074 domain-containing protein [Flavobacterium sp.]|nr:DUF5074 domain-containing protein [Flavobacterium sp.]